MTAINFQPLTPISQLQSGDLVRHKGKIFIILFQPANYAHPVAKRRGYWLCRSWVYGPWHLFSTYATVQPCPEEVLKIGDTCEYSAWELEKILL